MSASLAYGGMRGVVASHATFLNQVTTSCSWTLLCSRRAWAWCGPLGIAVRRRKPPVSWRCCGPFSRSAPAAHVMVRPCAKLREAVAINDADRIRREDSVGEDISSPGTS